MAKCDFRHFDPLEEVENVLLGADWKVHLSAFRAQGSAERLTSLDAVGGQNRLQVRSDKCDFRVQLSAVERAAENRPTVRAALRSDKCDFAVSLAGVMGGRQARSNIRTQMASDKCDFSVRLQFGPDPAPLFRVSAVASAKCDFQIRQIEVRQASGEWKAVDLAPPRTTK